MPNNKTEVKEQEANPIDLENFLKKKKIQNSILKKLIDKTEKDLPTNKNNKS